LRTSDQQCHAKRSHRELKPNPKYGSKDWI
jgi:hypothetical protein